MSVPYAIKAADADTLGGKPASAYALAGSAAISTGSEAATPAGGVTMPLMTPVVPATISGSMGYLSMFTDASNDLGNSSVSRTAKARSASAAPTPWEP